MKPSLERRLVVLESKTGPNTIGDWRERLARYKRWFVDGKWERSQTDEEKANLARYKQYFDQLDAGVAVPEWP